MKMRDEWQSRMRGDNEMTGGYREVGRKRDDAITRTNLPDVAFDWEAFAPHLADADLTEDQKKEFIETLWSIVTAFVDLGFGISAQDICRENGGQVIDLAELLNMAARNDATVGDMPTEKEPSSAQSKQSLMNGGRRP